jgi:4-cresol dehydrogenase (hydroxylating) flavoprotein subunit
MTVSAVGAPSEATLSTEAGRPGYGVYRAQPNFMDLAADQFSFNDHADLKFVRKIKDAVDPAGILSPGKQGIWPSAMGEQ